MENLRETLKLLFLRQSGEKLVKNICDGVQSAVRHPEEVWFVHEFPDTIASYSYDQKEQIFQLLQERWMCEDGGDNNLTYCKTPVIFNALHYFTRQCLKVVDDKLLCAYESLLRWHDLSSKLSEDLLITSYYAGCDLQTRTDRIDFAWVPVIGHDNESLNQILSQPLADLHFHLLGSSYQFDISWISLMNHPEAAEAMYKKDVWYPRKGEGVNKYVDLDDLFVLMIKACAIRRFLFRYITDLSTLEDYDQLKNQILRIDIKGEEEKTEDGYVVKPATGIMSIIPDLQNALNGDLDSSFKFGRDNQSETFAVDYALTGDLVSAVEKADKRYIYTVLAGERHLMYALYKRIYQSEDMLVEQIEMLYYAYLVIKGMVRQELVQLNNEIGLMNFSEYDKRKVSLPTMKAYKDLMKQMAIRSFCDKNVENYLEIRIQLRDKIKRIADDIKDIDKNVCNPWFCEMREGEVVKFWYVLHFVKEKDILDTETAEAKCRHQDLRENVRTCAKASAEWKYRLENQEPNRVVGIDAASAECYCRPEVFAQAFRFLRTYRPAESNPLAKAFMFTYHVGEDFYDLVDGLRAIDETLRFLEFKAGDRLGHALALGVDVKRYYRGCSQTVVMQKQTLLDNVAWLLLVGAELEGFETVKGKLEEAFEKYYSYIFDVTENTHDFQTYLSAWHLRSDEPTGYRMLKNGKPEWSDVTEWSEYERAAGEDYEAARDNPRACSLNHRYHYDTGVKERGQEACEYKLTFDMVKFIVKVQEAMLDKIGDMGVVIECCPTSNLRVGPIRQYREHPIFKFNNVGLHFNQYEERNIPVTINTDDKGIFATSLEREYALLGCALLKDHQREETSNTPEMIHGWLESVRQSGFDYRFGK